MVPALPRHTYVGEDFSPTDYTSVSTQNRVTEKTKTIWERIKLFIGGHLRDTFFWALYSRRSEDQKRQIQQENVFFRDFWNKSIPFSPRWPLRSEIIDTFTKNEVILSLQTPKRLTVTCCAIESDTREPSRPFYNIALVLGNISTIRNNITGVYPFIAAYLAKRRSDPTLPPARFILISQYDLKQGVAPYKPETIDDAGQILSSVLLTLREKYGPIHQLVSHSLGAIVTAAALKYMRRSPLPNNIYFDRGPSSIHELSRSKTGGSLLYLLAWISGWDIDLGKEIYQFCHSIESCPPIVISGVKKDHHFLEKGTLTQSSYIKQLENEQKVTVMEFDFAMQDLNETAQHNIGNGELYGYYLLTRAVKHRRFELRNEESMAQAIVERSLFSA